MQQQTSSQRDEEAESGTDRSAGTAGRQQNHTSPTDTLGLIMRLRASSRTHGGLSTRPDAFQHTPTGLTRLLKKRLAGKAPERGVGAPTAIGAGPREPGGAGRGGRGEGSGRTPPPALRCGARGAGPGRAAPPRGRRQQRPRPLLPRRRRGSLPPSLPRSGAALPAAARQRRRFLPGPPPSLLRRRPRRPAMA